MSEKKSTYNRLKKHRTLKRTKVDSTDDEGGEIEHKSVSQNNSPGENSTHIIEDFNVSENCVVEEDEQNLWNSTTEADLLVCKNGALEMQNSDLSAQDSESGNIDKRRRKHPSDSEISEVEDIPAIENLIKKQGSVKKKNLHEKLVKWITQNIQHLPHTVTDQLLLILRSEGHYELPKTTETLLKTKRSEGAITEMLSARGTFGDYVYLGIKSGLKSRLMKSEFKEDKIEVIVNIDAFPVFNKSDIEMTPILMQVIHPDYRCKPFIVALYSGNSKPHSPNEFFNDFVEESSHLIKYGVEIENRHYDFNLKALVCDTPARAFLKCTKGHTGFWACERCEIKGESVRTDKNNPRSYVRIYPDLNCPLRTKKSFKRQSQPEHHHAGETSPLLRISKFDPVRGVLLDSMHLLPEGVMKFLLDKLLSKKNKSKLSQAYRKLLSELLDQISSSVPDEFQRTSFPLSGLCNWKATQYRFILLYAGPLIFRKVLPRDLYGHFLFLNSACRILSDRDLSVERVDEAETLLRDFVSQMPQFYGKSSQVMNIHNLIHLADDVRYMKAPLPDYTAFPFENCLGKIKQQVRSANKVVAQVFRRNSEIEAAGGESILMRYPLISNTDKSKVYCGSKKISYSRIEVKKFKIGTTHPNNIVQLLNGQFFQVTMITSNTEVLDLNSFFMEGFFIIRVENVFQEPIKSEEIGIFKVRKMPSITEAPLKTVCMTQIKRKCILMVVGKKSYIVTLLHV